MCRKGGTISHLIPPSGKWWGASKVRNLLNACVFVVMWKIYSSASSRCPRELGNLYRSSSSTWKTCEISNILVISCETMDICKITHLINRGKIDEKRNFGLQHVWWTLPWWFKRGSQKKKNKLLWWYKRFRVYIWFSPSYLVTTYIVTFPKLPLNVCSISINAKTSHNS